MRTRSEEIDAFIAKNGGNMRDALNICMAQLKIMQDQYDILVKAYYDVDTAKVMTSYEHVSDEVKE